MAASDCGGGGIYNDTHNQWVIWNSANSSTYLYHTGSAVLNTLTNGVKVCKTGNQGYIDICPSGGWGHFITGNSRFYFNTAMSVNTGCISSYDEDLTLHRGYANSTAGERIVITSGTTHICQYTNVAGKLAVNASGLTCCCALNCGKADFEVCTGGTATAAWSGGRFRVGADDVNWSTRIRQNGYFETYGQNLNIQAHSGNRNIAICPAGTGKTCIVGCICATSNVQTAGKIHICSGHNCLHMASTCDAANYNFTIRSMYNWANSLCITNRCVPILKVCSGNCITSLWANNTERLCLHNSGTKIIGDLCVTGTITADGVEGDPLVCAGCCTGTICFNYGCVTGYDAVYDVYVSANPNCGGSSIYRDIVHMSVYVTTGWNGSAVTKYINHVNNFVRGSVHDSGASTVTAVPKLLVGTTGCECYAAACATCLQIQVAGGSHKNNTCVKIKRVL